MGTLEIVTDPVGFAVSLETEFRSSPPTLFHSGIRPPSTIAMRWSKNLCRRKKVVPPSYRFGAKAPRASRRTAIWRLGGSWFAIRRVLSEPCDTRAPNVPAIVERLGRGASLERLPRRKRRRWGASVTVVEDRSDRLIPYWRDQSRRGRGWRGCFRVTPSSTGCIGKGSPRRFRPGPTPSSAAIGGRRRTAWSSCWAIWGCSRARGARFAAIGSSLAAAWPSRAVAPPR